MVPHLTPIITIVIQNPLHPNRRVQVDGLVDTGSDISAIPASVIQELALKRRKQIRLTGVNGIETSFKRYVVNLELAGTHLERRAVVEWPGEVAVIGRDLLSEFAFFYDGKNRQFELRDP